MIINNYIHTWIGPWSAPLKVWILFNVNFDELFWLLKTKNYTKTHIIFFTKYLYV